MVSYRTHACLFALSTLLATTALADDVTPTPATTPTPGIVIKGAETLSYDSNPLMVPTGAKSLYGSTTSPELVLSSKTPLYDFSSDTRIDENIFDRSAFNSTDIHENANLEKHIERWGAGIAGRVDYDTTRTSEIANYGLNLPGVRHTGLSATPNIYYTPTTLDKVILAGTAAKSTYDNSAYTDYEIFSLNPSYEHNFDPMNKGIFSVNAQRYRTTQGSTVTVDSIGPTVGWQTLLTPRFTIKVDGGVQKSMQNSTPTTAGDSSWNYIFDADLSFKGEQDKTDFIASRSQYPFGNGTETLLTALSFTEDHALNKRVSLTTAANYQFAKQPAGSTTINLDREYGAGAGITYHVTQLVDLTLNYQYRNETLTNVSGTIDDNVVLAGITLRPFPVK